MLINMILLLCERISEHLIFECDKQSGALRGPFRGSLQACEGALQFLRFELSCEREEILGHAHKERCGRCIKHLPEFQSCAVSLAGRPRLRGGTHDTEGLRDRHATVGIRDGLKFYSPKRL